MLTSLDYYLHAENLRDPTIPSKDNDDQKILQLNWVKGTTGHTQPKQVVLDATFA